MLHVVLLGTLFAAQIGYATYVGGDAWEWMLYANRYMCIGMPALVVLVAVVLSQLAARVTTFDSGWVSASRGDRTPASMSSWTTEWSRVTWASSFPRKR